MKKLLFGAAPLSSRAADVTWLLFRLHLGLSIAIGAGWSKLVNLTTATEAEKMVGGAGSPPDWFVQQVADLGFTLPSAYFWAVLAVWGEFAGGLLVALGLGTRLAAFQLAVQFLVIAFFWYDKPEPLLGMYYQQLLFWAFVLVTGVGGGRYSADYWIWKRATARLNPPAARAATLPAIPVAG
ncbi:putative membrane protein YphA (DoxX/SURF4 family) [Hymenobacter luteus]|uniref:Membrane protein YphA (DoxX/SURF4 family) n=2 Tax=Hymenobacter TaxID=89966 RepID=A0ABR6JYB1_9BACT|nr:MULTISPECIES: DoxX family protein [Hymenobacter]MBB4601274.1 putative membrane protein YphA (DoxX/SURF4 family) [Hymenobacter latericoloratus]MBB6058519.1 putative membrane protein YphA (DoxX/SURF4 family) [Hymenobacter luteus]